ncbi:AAA family ATPase [Spirillospora sp. NPDC048911]|uniref:AAA family ATPase n=1 Tax=Spirillospora sp. NPDC048911 TaxID=3364527 RepID=UPI00371A0A53
MTAAIRNPFFEHPPSSQSAPRARLLTLEGMPGAGKTTLSSMLTGQGHRVIGEYTAQAPTSAGCADQAVLPRTLRRNEHPAVDDDRAHQANWIRKAVQATEALRAGGPVFVDRDWLSSLAYAYSIADTDQGRLLRQRVTWAQENLADQKLLVADGYMVFDLDVSLSLSRRAATLRPEHPWSRPRVLYRLRSFYRRPITILQRLSPELAVQLGQTRWSFLRGTTSLNHALTLVHALAQTTDGRRDP